MEKIQPMKICLKCGRNYSSDSMNFCLEDGSMLSTFDNNDKLSDISDPTILASGKAQDSIGEDTEIYNKTNFDTYDEISLTNIDRLKLMAQTLLAPSATSDKRRHWATTKLIFDSHNKFLFFKDNHSVGFLDLRTMKNKRIYYTGSIEKYVCDISLVKSGEFIVILNDDDSIRFWSLNTEKIEKTTFLPPNATDSGIFGGWRFLSSNGELVATITENKIVKVWETISGALLNEFNGSGKIAFSNDCELIAIEKSAGWFSKGELYIWRLKDKTLLGKIQDLSHSIKSISFSSCNQMIAVSFFAPNKTIKVWKVDNQTCLFTTHKQDTSPDLTLFAPDSSILSSSTNFAFRSKSQIQFWRSIDGRLIYTLKMPIPPPSFPTIGLNSNSPTAVAFSHDNKLFSVGSEDGQIRIYGIDND